MTSVCLCRCLLLVIISHSFIAHLGHWALEGEVEHGQDVVIEDQAAAALAVDRQLLQEGHTGLHSLGAGEQGAETETEGGSGQQQVRMRFYRMWGNRNVSYSSWDDSITRNMRDSKTAAIIWRYVNVYLYNNVLVGKIFKSDHRQIQLSETFYLKFTSCLHNSCSKNCQTFWSHNFYREK